MGARRRGETVDAYRNFIQTIAGRAGVSFEKALQLANYFETLPPGSSYPKGGGSAVRRVGQQLAKIMLDYEDGDRRPTLICRLLSR